MAIYGYARASTLEQNVTIQEEALRRAGCEVIRSEKVSGSSRGDDRNWRCCSSFSDMVTL
jgi:DNA invertase Pin-like site-specific DNA recombinase